MARTRSDAYPENQQLILDHAKSPHGKGLADGYAAESFQVNPTCGDEVRLRVHWRSHTDERVLSAPDCRSLADATALIVGVGGIGHETARLCLAFGMTVLGIDPRPEYEIPGAEVHPTADLDALLPRADFVISTTPHTPETEGMWQASRFQLMKPTAYFINIGRGGTTRIDDLDHALRDGATPTTRRTAPTLVTAGRRLKAARMTARTPPPIPEPTITISK